MADANRSSARSRVLVVDDEADVCAVISDQLEDQGYDVVCAANDEAAYDILESEGRSFSALIVDINLGRGTTGFDVARHARRERPDVPVIFVTGLSPTTIKKNGVEGAKLVRKPFSRDELLAALSTGRPN
jgi:DNA-binding response OmpR family regulator